MAFPVIASVTESDSETATHAVTMPATVDSGNLLLMYFVCDDDESITTPTSWTVLFSENAGVDTLTLTAFYIIAAGTEGGTTVDVNINSGEQSSAQTYRFTTWHGTTPPEAGTAATGTGTTPDPPSLNPSGWGTEDTMWISGAGISIANDDITAAPTNYTNFVDNNFATGGGSVELGTGRRERSAASEDPGVFAVTSSAEWVANVVAIRPAAAGGISIPVVYHHRQRNF